MGLLPGEIIDGRFQVGKPIGFGGQGVVLNIKHLEWERELALKLPLPEVLNSPKKRERFAKEAEAWIRLGVHPNIVRCWFVRNISGLPGLFLDLIPDGSLEDRIKDGRLGPGQWEEILDALLQVAEALSHAHGMGMVHRDIKPENLLVRENGQVCVTDFGLVKSTDRETLVSQGGDIFAQFDNKDSGTTGVGEFLGTPRYGAPEQWNKAMTITPATDVYAWGVILYEMLAGRRPFDAPKENPDPLELIHRHLRLEPPNPLDFQPDIPQPLVSLCLQCLAKDPLERPSDGLQLLEAAANAKRQLTGGSYLRPAPLPEKDRASLLNNAAVSLISLGRFEQGRENLEKGLLLHADHPECLYNLVQLDRRNGRMNSVESLQRLRRAKATYPLALLCIEEGHAKLAADLFKAIPDERKSGLFHRTEGDALMYLEEYEEANKCYLKARRKLPNDGVTFLRQQLAGNRTRAKAGDIYFPLSRSVFQGKVSTPQTHLMFTPDSQLLLMLEPDSVNKFDFVSGSQKRESRGAEASPVLDAWVNGMELLVQDQSGFEFWNIPTLRMQSRSPGKVMVVSQQLTHMVTYGGGKLYFVDRQNRSNTPLNYRIPFLPASPVRFNTVQNALYVATPDRVITQVGPDFNLHPLPWPSALPADIVDFLVFQDSLLAVATADQGLKLLDLANRKVLFQQKLPFQARQLSFSTDGNTLVAAGDQLFGVFDHSGMVLFRGKAACRVSQRADTLLCWTGGVLSLYALSPFRKIRSWAEKTPPPSLVRLSQNERRSLTLSGDGSFWLWEVDERHRAYERELLLTPGETYEQLLASFEHYQTHLAAALQYRARGNPFEAYMSVFRARNARGFLQSEEALGLQWEIGESLRRTAMEGLWERMFYRDVSAGALSANGQLVALVRGRECLVLDFSGSSVTPRHQMALGSEALAAHFQTLPDGETLLYVAERQGVIKCLPMSRPDLVVELSSEVGPLDQARFDHGFLFYRSFSGQARAIDLVTQQRTAAAEMSSQPQEPLFCVATGRLYDERAGLVKDLARNQAKEGFPLGMDSLPGRLSCLGAHSDRNLTLAGFSDGTITVGEASGTKVLFTTHQEVGGITDLKINIPLGLGVSVSDKGRLTVFDLNDGFQFQSFTAHSEAIKELQLNANGRYFTTRTEYGEFRLWETCWKLSETKGNIPVEWYPTGALSKLGRLFRLGGG